MTAPAAAPPLSRVRTFLFGALAVVWFSEMMILGVPSLSNVWTHLWQVVLPDNPQLATALSVSWSVSAPEKGALFVMAVAALISRDPRTRTALFASMALVPPLNIAFPFRQQGFLIGPVAVATTLSTILWGSFFLFREPARPEQGETRASQQVVPSRSRIFRDVWFATYSAVLTVMAVLFLFRPETALRLANPCLPSLPSGGSGGLESLVHTTLANGTHLTAVATASWLGTVCGRANPTLRRAVGIASTAHAGLMCLFPLGQMTLRLGGTCAASSLLIVFAPLFAAWVLYAAFSFRVAPTQSPLTQ